MVAKDTSYASCVTDLARVPFSQRGRQVYESLKQIHKGNTVVKAFDSHSKVKKLLSQFLASDAARGTRIVVATAGRWELTQHIDCGGITLQHCEK